MSTILVIGFIAFVILGIVASLGSNRQYDRIGESWLPEEQPALLDDSVSEEARQLVLARNRRRLRNGEPALDVDAEVARTLEELSGRADRG